MDLSREVMVAKPADQAVPSPAAVAPAAVSWPPDSSMAAKTNQTAAAPIPTMAVAEIRRRVRRSCVA